YYGFVHFNMNTFSDMEWGMGDEDPGQFDPSDLDTRQWARVVKDAGMKGIIITAKHHDGFCLWPTAYTEHSVKNSPWRDGKGDLIRELADACKEYGLKFGIYYSPWDRNHADYGKPEYISYMRNQLHELLTDYGDIFEVWFDGANGGTGYYGGANEERIVDKLTYYDWENTYALVRELQPGAVMFSDGGPDIRWVGNEEGYSYETTWANLMRDSVYAGMPEYPEKYAKGQENGTHWVPAEADVSIRPGWYYHEYEDHKVKSLSQLLDIYYKSIGRNSALLINFPVDRRGLIHEKDVEQIMKLSDKVKEDFSVDLAQKAVITATNERGVGYNVKNILEHPDTYWATEDDVLNSAITLAFTEPTLFNRLMVQEYIKLGQRIKSFIVEVETEKGWKEIQAGTTVGAKRILRFDDVMAEKIRFTIKDAKGSPTISRLGLFYAPPIVAPPQVLRDRSGIVTLSTPDKGVDVYYTIDGSEPDHNSILYLKPFKIENPTLLKAISKDARGGKISEAIDHHLDIPKEKWTWPKNSKAIEAIDEDPTTFWESDMNELIVDLGENYNVKGFTYLPPQNRYMKGIVSHYTFSTSVDGKVWSSVATGEFSNIKNNPIEQRVNFQPVNAKFIKLKAINTVDKNPASFAEVGIITSSEN
ncbi:MAG TPA: alpha-L-fucosidase, partial [Anditalea sp.]|nr:alpha-L-fucosidase [Anditalea sp.]